MKSKYLTINTVIRKYQVETTRTGYWGNDETALHTPASVKDFSDAVRAGAKDARITWAMSWRALSDGSPEYAGIRKLVRGFHEVYGDDVAFIPGGYFANVYNTREQVNRDIDDATDIIKGFMGGYAPRSLVAGFLSAANHEHAATKHGIRAVQGNIWGQYAVDLGDGDGSINYPYYPSRQHFNKPAQGEADKIDCFSLDGWTMDFITSLRTGVTREYNSRLGVGPLETLEAQGIETGLREMMHCTAVHFDELNLACNPFGWVTNNYEICEATAWKSKGCLDGFAEWIRRVRAAWPDVKVCTIADMADELRRERTDNDGSKYFFYAKGSGINGSDPAKEIAWIMRKEYRMAILRTGGENFVADFTDYRRDYSEPMGENERNWTLFGEINQKNTRPQDKPVPLAEFSKWSEVRRALGAEELKVLADKFGI